MWGKLPATRRGCHLGGIFVVIAIPYCGNAFAALRGNFGLISCADLFAAYTGKFGGQKIASVPTAIF